MADEANPCSADSSTLRTREGGIGRLCVGSSLLPPLALLLGVGHTLILCPVGSQADGTAPGRAFRSATLPGLGVDVKVFEGGFQTVFVAFLLASCSPLSLAEFPIEELFGDSAVRHARDMACPPELGFADYGGDGLEPRALQDFCVGNSVLPADVEKISEASEVEAIQLIFMSFIWRPSFAAVE